MAGRNLMAGTFYYLGNSRNDDQRQQMVDLESRGVCLFCPNGLAADTDQRIALSTDHWNVTENEFPYSGTRLHLLLVPKMHVSDLLHLDERARADMWTALDSIRRHFSLTFYGLGARNGDPRYTGGTIAHVHMHVIVGDVDDENHHPVRLKLSSRPID